MFLVPAYDIVQDCAACLCLVVPRAVAMASPPPPLPADAPPVTVAAVQPDGALVATERIRRLHVIGVFAGTVQQADDWYREVGPPPLGPGGLYQGCFYWSADIPPLHMTTIVDSRTGGNELAALGHADVPNCTISVVQIQGFPICLVSALRHIRAGERLTVDWRPSHLQIENLRQAASAAD